MGRLANHLGIAVARRQGQIVKIVRPVMVAFVPAGQPALRRQQGRIRGCVRALCDQGDVPGGHAQAFGSRVKTLRQLHDHADPVQGLGGKLRQQAPRCIRIRRPAQHRHLGQLAALRPVRQDLCGDIIQPVGRGMLGHDLAQRRQPQPGRAILAFGQGAEPAGDLAAIIRGDHQIAEHDPQAAGIVADRHRVRGQELIDAAGEHALRLFDRVQVDRIAIALIGHVDPVRGQCADDKGLEGIRKGVVGIILAIVAVKDVQRFQRRQAGGEVFQIPRPLGITRVIGAGEIDRVLALEGLDRVVDPGLAGKGQQPDPVVIQRPPIQVDTVDIRGENGIEKLSRAEEGRVMDRIFLVPEHGRHLVLAAPCHQIVQFLAAMPDLAVPAVILAAPGGFDEQEIRAEIADLLAPVAGRQLLDLGLGGVAGQREAVHDRGDAQIAARRGQKRLDAGRPLGQIQRARRLIVRPEQRGRDGRGTGGLSRGSGGDRHIGRHRRCQRRQGRGLRQTDGRGIGIGARAHDARQPQGHGDQAPDRAAAVAQRLARAIGPAADQRDQLGLHLGVLPLRLAQPAFGHGQGAAQARRRPLKNGRLLAGLGLQIVILLACPAQGRLERPVLPGQIRLLSAQIGQRRGMILLQPLKLLGMGGLCRRERFHAGGQFLAGIAGLGLGTDPVALCGLGDLAGQLQAFGALGQLMAGDAVFRVHLVQIDPQLAQFVGVAIGLQRLADPHLLDPVLLAGQSVGQEQMRRGGVERIPVMVVMFAHEAHEPAELGLGGAFDIKDRLVAADHLQGALQHIHLHALDIDLDRPDLLAEVLLVQRHDLDLALAKGQLLAAEIGGDLCREMGDGRPGPDPQAAHRQLLAQPVQPRTFGQGIRQMPVRLIGDDPATGDGGQIKAVIADIGAHIQHQIARRQPVAHILQHLKLIGLALLGNEFLDIVRSAVGQDDAV